MIYREIWGKIFVANGGREDVFGMIGFGGEGWETGIEFTEYGFGEKRFDVDSGRDDAFG
jgi:hypothetical protein